MRKVFTPKDVLRVLFPVLVLFCAASAANGQSYTESEQSCFDMVQGKVAFDKAGNKKWSETNLRRLCKNTTAPIRTIDCFGLRIVNYNDWKRGIDECSAELNGKWIAYSAHGTLTDGRWEIAGLGGIDFRTSGGQQAFTGTRSGNKITTTFKDFFGNVMTGTISNNATKINWSSKMIWIKDDGKPPAPRVSN